MEGSGAALQDGQKDKLGRRCLLQCSLSQLRREHPGVFFTLADTVPKYTTTDTSETCVSSVNCRGAIEMLSWGEADASFHLPLSQHERRTAQLLLTWHCFDHDAAKAAASLAARCPSILLSKYLLLYSFGSIMQQAQPQLAPELTNMFVRYLDLEYLHRLVKSPLTPDIKFKIAASELQKREPRIAEMLKFRLHAARHPLASGPVAQQGGSSLDALSVALNHPDVRHMAAAGELLQLPVWLQQLPCTSAVNEADSIQVTLHAPTKVYMLCLSPKSHPPSLLKPPRYVTDACASAWRFETSAQLFARYCGIQTAEAVSASFLPTPKLKFLKAKSTDSCLVCSTILEPGVYKLPTEDAIYFFDTQRHVQQRRLRASQAALCMFMQRNGDCGAGDCCKFSHAPPQYFSPEVPVYIRCMLLQCRGSLQAALHLPITDQMTYQTRVGLYCKHSQHGWFPARRRVHSAGMMAALLLRLVHPSTTRCKALALAAAQELPLHIYRGLMLRADDFDDNDASTYVEHNGYRYRTLFKHRHSRQSHRLDSGVVLYSGGGQASESGRRELPVGWEVCPPDDASIAVCMQYTWQSTSLVLSDCNKHATKGCHCQDCSMCTAPQNSRKPHSSPSNALFDGRWVTIEGTDVLVRRRCWGC